MISTHCTTKQTKKWFRYDLDMIYQNSGFFPCLAIFEFGIILEHISKKGSNFTIFHHISNKSKKQNAKYLKLKSPCAYDVLYIRVLSIFAFHVGHSDYESIYLFYISYNAVEELAHRSATVMTPLGNIVSWMLSKDL